jgi:ABC-2 type transport system permease protein
VWSGYLGLVCYSAAATALGLLISALTESQMIALVVTVVTLLFLHLIGFAVDTGATSGLRDVIAFVSFDTRLAPFARGKIVTSDIIYFASITVGCLMAAFRALERRKWA